MRADIEEMTYSESAEGVQITWERAILELARHGFDTPNDIREFGEEMGVRDTYNAGDVLRYLGY